VILAQNNTRTYVVVDHWVKFPKPGMEVASNRAGQLERMVETMRKQSGFTLIEIAIVLVIIGLLLGGILKGQELINSAKVKSLATDFRTVPVFIYGYQDKFRSLPGDDSAATTHLVSGGSAITNGNGNGIIDGSWDDTSGEAFNFWQHVRLAGLAPGPTNTADATYRPKNSEGGFMGIQGLPSTTPIPITGLRGTYAMCSSGILGKFVLQLDTTLDDGTTNTGSMMAALSGSAPLSPVANSSVVESNAYVVCMAF